MNNEQLKSIIERIERLNEEKQAIQEDIKQVYSEAKANGYDVKILRLVVKLRTLDPAKVEEQDVLTETYLKAIGG